MTPSALAINKTRLPAGMIEMVVETRREIKRLPDRNWPRKWVARICKAAGVPRVTAHGMRGLHGTLAVETGLSAHAVAAALGHESVTTTLQSYAKAGAGASARQEKVLTVLAGGKKGQESAA